MASYFNMLKEGRTCAVAKVKIIEWKLSGIGWWINRKHHDRVPCPCAKHHRTPLDILWLVQIVTRLLLGYIPNDMSLPSISIIRYVVLRVGRTYVCCDPPWAIGKYLTPVGKSFHHDGEHYRCMLLIIHEENKKCT